MGGKEDPDAPRALNPERAAAPDPGLLVLSTSTFGRTLATDDAGGVSSFEVTLGRVEAGVTVVSEEMLVGVCSLSCLFPVTTGVDPPLAPSVSDCVESIADSAGFEVGVEPGAGMVGAIVAGAEAAMGAAGGISWRAPLLAISCRS